MIEVWKNNFILNKGYFFGWVLALLGFGLLGFWSPIVFKLNSEINVDYGNIVISGSLSTFSIVILIEGILDAASYTKSKRPWVILIISMIVMLFSAMLYGWTLTGVETKTIKWVVLIVSAISFINAIILYGYRKIDPEDGAEVVVEDDNDRVASNMNEAVTIDNPLPPRKSEKL